ncbi:MAG: oligosaccharide flippase family protein [Bacteroidales bacterium]
MSSPRERMYRSVIKSTALFGSVQFISAIISLLRNKFVALFLGIEGVGIISLLITSLQLLQSITSFGVDKSGVREIAAQTTKEAEGRVVSTLKWLTLVLALFGALVLLILAPYMSKLMFGSDDYTIPFRILSLALLFDTLSKGNLAIFQGRRMLNQLAKASLIGSFVGLIVSVPLYYLYGIESIATSMVVTSLMFWLTTLPFSVRSESNQITLSEKINNSKPLIRLGIAFTISSTSVLLSSYIFSIYMTRQSSIEEFGLYQGGYNIVMRYVGMLFAAMATDYYPQLTTISTNIESVNKLLNRQSEIALLILLPIAVIFILLIEPIILILLSSDFLPIVPFAVWSLLGVVVKVLSWSIGFVMLAKGLSKLFWISELFSAMLFLGGNILGYSILGLEGIAISYVVVYILYLIFLLIYMGSNYGVRVNRDTTSIFFIVSIFVSAMIGLTLNLQGTVRYIASLPIVIAALVYSWRELDRRVAITELIKQKLIR